MADDRFAADHAPGAMKLSASRIPCLVLPREHRPSYMPSAFAYGAHLLGLAPLPEADNSLTRRGRRMELIGEVCAIEDHGLDVIGRQVRHELETVPAVTYLDLVTSRAPLELKTVEQRDFDRKWAGRPPLHVRTQAQAQAWIGGFDLILIGAIVVGSYQEPTLELFEEPAHPGMQALMRERCETFMDDLRRGVLPPMDEAPSSYTAWSATAHFANGAATLLAEPEAVERAARGRQARADAKAAEAVEEACRLFFMANAPTDAERIELLDGTVIARKAIDRKGFEVKPSRIVQWKIETPEAK
jgi:hypothetical protein